MDATKLVELLMLFFGLPPDTPIDKLAEMLMAKLRGEQAPAMPAAEEGGAEGDGSEQLSAEAVATRSALGLPLAATAAEITAAIQARSIGAKGADVLVSRVAALEAAERRNAVEARIAANPGKLHNDELRRWARTLAPAALDVALAALPDMSTLTGNPVPLSSSGAPVTGAGPAGPVVTLSAVDAELCKKLGTDPSRIAARRAAERNGARHG